MTHQRNPRARDRNWTLAGIVIGVILVLWVILYAMSDRHSAAGNNVSQSTNPTNASGTSKQP